MAAYREIRADYDSQTIVVYQAYRPSIAEPAVREQRFVAPFSFGRMTWIKPSFLWLMQRSNWASKSGQECILAVRISRHGWEQALRLASLTSFTPAVHPHIDAWRTEFSQSQVHVQWDPERSLRGKKLEHRSLQVGISRHLIRNYVEHWIQEITDYTPRVKKIRQLCLQGDYSRANRLLPPERVYELPDDLAQRLAMTTS